MRRLHAISLSYPALLLTCAAWGQPRQAARLEDLTHPEAAAQDVRVLVLPIGSTEPHAGHLCYGNDTWTAAALAASAAEKANEAGARVLVLPAMPYGINVNLTAIPYAQAIRPATLIQFVKDLVDTAEKQGIRKLVIVNSHGGNTATLGAAQRELYASHPRVFVAMVQPGGVVQDAAASFIEKPGEHASEAETAISLALFPDKVRMEKAVAPQAAEVKIGSLKAPYVTFVRPWKYVSDTTGLGDPTKATPEKGRKLVDVFVERVSRLLKELNDVEVTESFPY